MMKREKSLRKKIFGRICGLGLAVAVVACIGVWSVPAMAAESESAGSGYKDTNYTIRIYSGDKGTYNGQAEYHVPYGTVIPVYPQKDTEVPSDSIYYVKGIRESGLDNSEAVEDEKAALTVTEDKDYVIAYGVKGKTVAYTVNYINADTDEPLAQSETYYGNIGDKPVIAYLYIEGYLPQAYNLTKTLSADESENVFTFEYSVNEGENTVVENTTTTTTTTTTTVGTAATGTTAGTTAGTAAGGAAAGGAAAGAGAGEGAAGPADIVDLDEGDVPLAGVDDANGDNGDGTTAEAGDEETINDDQTPLAGMSTAAKAGIGVIIAAAIVAIIAALAVRARKKKQEDEV